MEAAQILIPQAPSKRRPDAVCSFVKTVVTTTFSKSNDSDEKMEQIIAQLQKTRLNFSKLSQLQKKRLRNMQKLIRRKNSVIAILASRLNTRRCAKTKHFAVTICKNVVYTTSGSKKFVEQRVEKLCAIGGEQVFSARRANCARDRLRVAKALAVSLGTGVIASATNKRFEIRDAEKLISAKFIIKQVLHNGYHDDARTN
ncbi:ODV-E26 [Choristoneura rosaceana nucleopolyhedrovirus]|uniref:ODV-E26 n=1 Tax=Choristoneura rosaceana nucleopolyhedrovirus TaxID=58094 RepID=S5MRE9_9ABAC|nr:ODV-E26 [Choristoneura rosaceana nucleopolyhedrovirus]AGR57174.1 ODV-E26 [Choristoneura rosaceana nucleopolyhedrovirus]